MDSTFMSFLPIVIVLAIVGVIIYRSRKTAKAEGPGPQGQKPYGVHGWLALYVFSLVVLSPLYGFGQMVQSIQEAEEKNPMVLAMDGWSTYKAGSWILLVVVILWQWRGAWLLKHRWEPSTIRFIKMMLVGALLLMLIGDYVLGAATLGVTDTANSFLGAIKGIFTSGIWFAYFSVSKRVKNTYFPAKEEQVTPVVEPVAGGNPVEVEVSPAFTGASSTPIVPMTMQPAAAHETVAVTESPLSLTIEDKMAALRRLLDQGLITKEDYDIKKKDLLNGL